MNFLDNLFRHGKSKDPIAEQNISEQKSPIITAKEKQLYFIKSALKVLLKEAGYKTAGNKWWKHNDLFFNFRACLKMDE
jgi:hypothetical protein